LLQPAGFTPAQIAKEIVMKPQTAASIGALVLMMGLAPVAIAQTAPSAPTERGSGPISKDAPAAQKPPEKMPAEKVMPSPQTKSSTDESVTTQAAGTVLGTDIIGKAVYGADQKKIGTANDIVFKQNGSSVEAIVVGIGGFLGLGEHNVALKLEKFSFMPSESGRVIVVLNASKEELEKLPAFKTQADQAAEASRNAARPTSPTTPVKPGPATR
jgi:sporulation protein YlmC with PRC-barrel domain